MRIRRREPWVFATTVLLLALATGCAEDEASRTTPSSVPTPSSSRAPTASEAPTSPTAVEVPERPIDGRFIRSLNPSETAEEKVIADTWFRYHEQTTRMFSDLEVDHQEWSAVAEGAASESELNYVRTLKARNHHNVGGNIGAIEQITVDGTSARVTGCLLATLVEVDERGVPQEEPEGFLRVMSTLRQHGTAWKVTSVSFAKVPHCQYR